MCVELYIYFTLHQCKHLCPVVDVLRPVGPINKCTLCW